jgi:hypothetical protein
MAKASTKRLFTPQLIERLSPEKGRRVEIMDSNCPGLVLRVTEGGVRTFGVLYRVAGKGGVGGRGKPLMGPQQRFTLGKYPRIGLKQARERARAIIDEASEGVDPKEAEAKARAIRNSTKIEDIVTQFVDRHCKPNIKAWQNVDRVLRLHVVPRLVGLSITEITRTDIHGLLDDLVDQGTRGTAREVRKHVSKLYNWAMDRQIVAASPVQGLMRIMRTLCSSSTSYVWPPTANRIEYRRRTGTAHDAHGPRPLPERHTTSATLRPDVRVRRQPGQVSMATERPTTSATG